MNLQNYKTCIDTIDVNTLNKLKYIVDEHTNIIILGNGGSNAISCHIAQD